MHAIAIIAGLLGLVALAYGERAAAMTAAIVLWLGTVLTIGFVGLVLYMIAMGRI